MKKFLNTLYVTTQGAYLAKEGECVVVKSEQKIRLRLPIHNLGGIVCFGQISCSPFLMAHCAEHNVTISFLTENGRFLAKVQGPVSGNVLLRREQYRQADDGIKSAQVAYFILTGKLINSRGVLQRMLRDHADKIEQDAVKYASDRIAATLLQVSPDLDLDALRGLEGDAAHSYFSVFDQLVLSQKKYFQFSGRNRRPPLDRINCLLSFVYTILLHDVRSALETVGLDSAVGFLHRDRPGRPGLALDMMEEFRSIIADKLVLSLINQKQIKPQGFTQNETGAVFMNEETRKNVLVAYQKRKKAIITHPFLKKKMELGLVFHVQAMLLSRYLRGDMDAYPPFIWR